MIIKKYFITFDVINISDIAINFNSDLLTKKTKLKIKVCKIESCKLNKIIKKNRNVELLIKKLDLYFDYEK